MSGPNPDGLTFSYMSVLYCLRIFCYVSYMALKRRPIVLCTYCVTQTSWRINQFPALIQNPNLACSTLV